MVVTLQTGSRRQAGLTALYLGIFSTVWFSVAKLEQPLQTLLVVGSVAAVLTAVTGAVVSARARPGEAAPRDRVADRRYLLIVGAEFAAAGIGALVLASAGWPEFVPVWIGAVVGAHFLPLAPLLRDPLLRPLAAVVCLVALAALIVALASAIPAGHVAGPGIGLVLLGYAVMALARTAKRP